MRSDGPPFRIVAVDRLDDGVLVEFADGKSGSYPDTLLYSLLDQAHRPDELEAEEERA
jgi:hypothetical protein